MRRGAAEPPPPIERSSRRGGAEPPAKYDSGIYLLVVASRTAASLPSQRNLSNSWFLRVLFWNIVVRDIDDDDVMDRLFLLLV